MPTLYTHIDSNKRRTWFLLTLVFLLIIAVGWAISYIYNNQTILYVAVIFSTLSSLISYWWSDKIVLLQSQAKPISRQQAPEFYRLVENLCITAGLPVPKIYLIEDSAPNAFATGRDPEHAVVAVTTGILGKLEKTELEGVIAHELSHIGNRDILLATIVTVLVGTVVLLADWFLRFSLFGHRGRSNDREGGSQVQLIITVVAIVFIILSPLFVQLMQLAISRKREFLADADGALLTRHPEGLASALEKLSADQEPLEAANRATAHLYIVSPLKGKNTKGFWSRALATHPPLEERIKRLRGMSL